MKTRTHLKTGTSDVEWFRLSVNEAKGDPVGFWEMVKVGRHGFGLDGEDLEGFVKDFIVEMLKSGAQAVMGDKSAKFGWSPISQYAGEPHVVAESLVADWRASQVDPDVDGVWFAYPSVYS